MDDINSSANLLIFKGERYRTSRPLLKNPKKTGFLVISSG